MHKRYLVITAGVLLSGCYTQFASLQPPPKQTAEITVDSAGDTVKVVKQVDTVVVRDRQNCIWERDIFGYPRLRCYDSYYPRDWYVYNYAPWWYRDDPYWYDYDRCPRYYYYDRTCGCCRYYLYDPYHYSPGGGGGGSSGGGGGSSGSSGARSPSHTRTYGVPSSGTTAGPGSYGSTLQNGGQSKRLEEQQPAPAQSKPSYRPSRSYGIPEPAPAESSKELQKRSSTQEQSQPEPQVPTAPQENARPSTGTQSADTGTAQPRPRRISPRSW